LATNQPNLILIMCDQLRYDCLGYAGHSQIQTPNLDRLAETGVVFETAYCASPVCSPARASWLTGTYPHAHHQLANYGPQKIDMPEAMAVMRPDAVTLGDLFKDAGYRCGMSGPWHLGNDHQPQHGFTDFWHAYRYQGDHPDRFFDYLDEEGVPNLYAADFPGVQTHGLSYVKLTDPRQQRTTWTISQGIEFLDTGDGGPFFLFLSVKDPHPLIAVSPEQLERYPPDQIKLPSTFKDTCDGKPEYLPKDPGRLPSNIDVDGFRNMVSHYYALVTHIDHEVGRLLSHLESLGLTENTMVAFISDHGEMLGDHGSIEKRLFYEASSRVPCLLNWPAGLPKGFSVTTPLGGVDLMPTILDLAGISLQTPVDGRSVAEAIVHSNQPDSAPVFSEIGNRIGIRSESTREEDLAARVMVREGFWKYILNRTDIDELYNLESDPDEMTNLGQNSEQSDRIAHMQGLIQTMVQKTGPGPYVWCLTQS